MVIKDKYLKDYEVVVYFSNGQIRQIDLLPFLESTNLALVKKYLDKSLFKNVRVEYGTICWGDNEFDINPLDIYNGVFEAADSPYIAEIQKH